MKLLILTISVWLSLGGMSQAAQDQKKAACAKDCSDYLKVCRQAHSAGACNSEFNICMGFCRKK